MAIEQYTFNSQPREGASQNVIDIYKGWLAEEIRADLIEKRSPMVSICMNTHGDFNLSNVIRSNNNFLGEAVYIVGRRGYDRRGAVGQQNYQHVYHADNLQEVVEKLHADGYTVYAVDNIYEFNPKNFYDVAYPAKSAFVYGQEQQGLLKEEIELCDDMVFIGGGVNNDSCVRSLNISTAAACVMSEYTRQHRVY